MMRTMGRRRDDRTWDIYLGFAVVVALVVVFTFLTDRHIIG